MISSNGRTVLLSSAMAFPPVPDCIVGPVHSAPTAAAIARPRLAQVPGPTCRGTIDLVSSDPLLASRAVVLHDLGARGLDTAPAVDVLEAVVSERRWWVDEWPDGAAYVAGQVAQDVQDRLLDGQLGRWPRCTACDETDVHELRVSPELGPDPHWVCEKSGITVSPLGSLPPTAS
jgi:hypothetical protein